MSISTCSPISTLRIRKLFEDRFVCVVRRGHPFAKGELTLGSYASFDHVQVTPRGRPGGYLDNLLEAHGHKRHIARAVPYFRSALELVAESDYVLTVSTRLARRYADELDLVILAPPLDIEGYSVSMIWHPRHDSDPAHRWLRQVFAEAASELDDFDSPISSKLTHD